jgi:hypothetical protein
VRSCIAFRTVVILIVLILVEIVTRPRVAPIVAAGRVVGLPLVIVIVAPAVALETARVLVLATPALIAPGVAGLVAVPLGVGLVPLDALVAVVAAARLVSRWRLFLARVLARRRRALAFALVAVILA